MHLHSPLEYIIKIKFRKERSENTMEKEYTEPNPWTISIALPMIASF